MKMDLYQLFSAETKQGREEIWAYMAGLPDVGRA